MSIKALAKAVLQGNHQGNFEETESYRRENFKETTPHKGFLSNAQQQASEWRWFCDGHERDLSGSYCKLKRDKHQDPFVDCIGWQIKTQKETTE